MAVTFDAASGNSGFDGTGTATSVSVTLGDAVSVGDAIIVGFTWSGASSITGVTDNLGNVYGGTPDVTLTDATIGTVAVIYSCKSVTHAGTPTIKVQLNGVTGTLNDMGVVRLTNGGQAVALGNTNTGSGTGLTATTSAVANPAGSCAIEWTGQTQGSYSAAGSFSQIAGSPQISDLLAGDNLASAGTIGANAAVNGGSNPWAIVLAIYTNAATPPIASTGPFADPMFFGP